MGPYDEIWSYPEKRIEEFLFDSGAEKTGGVFLLPGCRVTTEALPDRRMGNLSLPRTRVRMEGSGAEAFHRKFLLNFLSGGG